jgi:hypothetical protein
MRCALICSMVWVVAAYAGPSFGQRPIGNNDSRPSQIGSSGTHGFPHGSQPGYPGGGQRPIGPNVRYFGVPMGWVSPVIGEYSVVNPPPVTVVVPPRENGPEQSLSYRIWRTADEKRHVNAAYLGRKGPSVRLLRDNGDEIGWSFNRLSEADQDFVRSMEPYREGIGVRS